MAQTAPNQPPRHTIECPVCQAHGAMLRHDIRGSLVYFCRRCQHEWQIDPQVIGLEAGSGTDKIAGQIARFFNGGVSDYLIVFRRDR